MVFFVKIVDRFSLFQQNAPSQMFDRVLTHTSVKIIRLLQKQPAAMFHKKAILKNCATFTGKHLCWSLSLIKLQSFRPATKVYYCEYCEIFKNTYFEKKFERLLLVLVQCQLAFGTRSNTFWLYLEGFCEISE